jgi:hypothetical protein
MIQRPALPRVEQNFLWLEVRRSAQHSAQLICWGVEAQGFSGTLIELSSDLVQMCLRVALIDRFLGEVLAKQSIGVLRGTSLPRTTRIAKVQLHVG